MFAASSKRAFSSITTVTCFPVARSFDQLLHKRRIGTGPVERLLYREHVGVFCSLRKKIHHRLKVVVRVMQENVPRRIWKKISDSVSSETTVFGEKRL